MNTSNKLETPTTVTAPLRLKTTVRAGLVWYAPLLRWASNTNSSGSYGTNAVGGVRG